MLYCTVARDVWGASASAGLCRPRGATGILRSLRVVRWSSGTCYTSLVYVPDGSGMLAVWGPIKRPSGCPRQLRTASRTAVRLVLPAVKAEKTGGNIQEEHDCPSGWPDRP
jgi:hypothetical protein